MGYYDFDNHFWSPREVCAQAPQPTSQEQSLRGVAGTLRNILRRLSLRRAIANPSQSN